MTSIDDLLGQLPIAQIAARLGTDEQTATAAVRHALPALVGGMQANAEDPGGASSLESALQQHADTDHPTDIDAVDTDDGQKIVNHVFGGNADGVVQQLGSTSGVSSGMIQKLMPMLAPIVMSYLAKRVLGGGGSASSGSPGGSGGLGNVLGGLLGGSGGGVLGGVLGGLLGGGRR